MWEGWRKLKLSQFRGAGSSSYSQWWTKKYIHCLKGPRLHAWMWTQCCRHLEFSKESENVEFYLKTSYCKVLSTNWNLKPVWFYCTSSAGWKEWEGDSVFCVLCFLERLCTHYSHRSWGLLFRKADQPSGNR